MAAAKLVTRCPACRTAFRLVADQLRLRQGLVRCGQCDTVFDAREHLIELPAPEPAAGPETVAQAGEGIAAPAPATPPAPSPPHRGRNNLRILEDHQPKVISIVNPFDLP